MRSFKMKLLGAAVTLAVSGGAQATNSIVFDYNGTDAGGQITVGSFDWTPDNALAVGAVPLAVDPASGTFELYAQGSLGNFLDGSSQVINGTGLNTDFEITFQTGFTEVGSRTVDTSGPIAGSTAGFTLAPVADQTVNFFKIYYDTVVDVNQIAGTGYGASGTSILILEATVTGNTTVFTVPFSDPDGNGVFDTPTISLLDNFGVDNQGGTLTVNGGGGGPLQADATTQDFDYFVSNIISLLVDLEFNTSTITPFSQANPSDLVVGIAPTYGNLGGTPTNGFDTCGSVTGPCDFHFQADANTAFNSVPEPGSMLLLGAGLVGMGWVARRRKV